MKQPVPVSKANRLLNSGNTVLVSSHDGQKANILAVAWQMPVSHDPMMVSIAVGKKNYSHDIIKKTKEFVINVPNAEILSQTLLCGKKSGREVDKFDFAGLTALSSTNLKVPLVKECIGHLEVTDVSAIPVGDHSIFIGTVVAASSDEGLFNETWNIKHPRTTLLYHWGGLLFTTTGKQLEV